MKKLLIPILVMAVILLGYFIFQESKIKNEEVNRVIHEISALNVQIRSLNFRYFMI